MKTELPAPRMPIIPEGAPAFQEKLEDIQLSKTVTCPTNQHSLVLGETRFEWLVGKQNFYLGPIPGYKDVDCGKTYVNANIMNLAKDAIKTNYPGKINSPRGIATLK